MSAFSVHIDWMLMQPVSTVLGEFLPPPVAAGIDFSTPRGPNWELAGENGCTCLNLHSHFIRLKINQQFMYNTTLRGRISRGLLRSR